uniref:Putative secreted protein n=1 Tax=Anopheles marajoara TaxID=58244 RepID=A0A2M4CES2_9DIPT
MSPTTLHLLLHLLLNYSRGICLHLNPKQPTTTQHQPTRSTAFNAWFQVQPGTIQNRHVVRVECVVGGNK